MSPTHGRAGAIMARHVAAAPSVDLFSAILARSPAAAWWLGEATLPVVSIAASSSNFSSEPPSNAFDGNFGTYWTTNGVSSGWIRAQLSSAKALTRYTISRRDDIPNRNPKTWTFEGSNDGSSWTVLDTQTNITWPTAGTRGFSFTNTTAFLYYRLNITANNGDTYLSVAELGLATAADATGNGHHLNYFGNPTVGSTGIITSEPGATAVAFDGSNDSIRTPYGPWMDMATAFSAVFVIQASLTSMYALLDRDSNSSRVFQFRTNSSGKLEFVKISGSVVTSTGVTTVTDGTARLVGVTYDGSNIRLYVGASLDQTTAAPGSLTGTDRFAIGVNSSGADNSFFIGKGAAAAIFPSVLSGADFATLAALV
jgi:hypothetical protein